MKNVLILFGSITPEHDLSCKSAARILENIDRSQYQPIAVGITADGKWLYTESTPEEIFDCKAWETSPTNRKALLDLDHGAKSLLVFEQDGTSSAKRLTLRLLELPVIPVRTESCRASLKLRASRMWAAA